MLSGLKRSLRSIEQSIANCNLAPGLRRICRHVKNISASFVTFFMGYIKASSEEASLRWFQALWTTKSGHTPSVNDTPPSRRNQEPYPPPWWGNTIVVQANSVLQFRRPSILEHILVECHVLGALPFLLSPMFSLTWRSAQIIEPRHACLPVVCFLVRNFLFSIFRHR